MLLQEAHKNLCWPSPKQIFTPTGAGPRVLAHLASEKIGKEINRFQDGINAQVGILSANPRDNATESPIAIVCESKNPISPNTLQKLHKLAWNFSRSPLLLILEPHFLRAWTCCEPPAKESEPEDLSAEILKVSSLSHQSAQALHWVQLASGQFFKEEPSRFKRESCADITLLKHLKFVRQKLKSLGLKDDFCHDLLARVIFIQFLFHRKDSSGTPALNEKRLNRLYTDGILKNKYQDLPGILENYKDSYGFFRWLNERFNGDLFPAKSSSQKEREAEWKSEMDCVAPQHLELLSKFVSGKVKMETGQMSFWPSYSFDAIPLEFISSIYEEFVGKKEKGGVVYTPGHIVDFLLDGVLPWNSKEWDLKVLDPACGSGIFLVKAYQRLIHRWREANPGKEPKADLLRRLLEQNLFGIDIDPHAVRVASFSLYLAMCDEMDPRHYWEQVKFPRLREKRLIHSDFFEEEKEGFRTKEDSGKYDIVIGNAPWGKNTVTAKSKKWAKNNKWEITYGDIGTLFLPKSAALAKSTGQTSMIQPAMSILFKQGNKSKKFRSKFFNEYTIEEVTNLSALRFGLFKDAISPSCIITFCPTPHDGKPFSYICPKPTCTTENEYRVIIEPHDVNLVYPKEAAEDSLVWTTLMWGGRRDFAFIRWLSQLQNIGKLESDGIVLTRQGINRGDRKKKQIEILGKPLLTSKTFPENTFLFLKAKDLPKNDDPYTHYKDSTNYDAFKLPQLLLKQGWQKKHGRFQAAITQSISNFDGALSSKSYVSIHVPNQSKSSILDATWLSFNSKLAVYYLLLTSGRFSSYRPEVNVEDILKIPIPPPRPGLLEGIENHNDVDQRTRQAFDFKDSEWVLVEDLFDYTLPDFKGDASSAGRRKSTRNQHNRHTEREPELKKYCEYFLKVLFAGFGDDKNVCATIFQEEADSHLPVRLIAIHLDWPDREKIKVEPINYPGLLTQLLEINQKFMESSKENSGDIFYQRVVRVYDTVKFGNKSIPTIFLIKPDQIRYWTRSIALRDADEVAVDILEWRQSGGSEWLH